MTVLAVIRPDSWNFPLFLHVLGAMILVGGVGVYRLRKGKGSGLLKATLVLSIILLAAYVVAVWAMAGKPD